MVYIQSNDEKSRPHHFDVACAMFGCIDLGWNYRLTSFEEVQSGKFDLLIKNNIFVGSVEFMREVFTKIGKQDSRVPRNNDDDYEEITIKEVKDRISNGAEIFIKPIEIKLFSGMVVSKKIGFTLNNLPDDLVVMAYKPYQSKIESEWRIYIHDGKIIDSKNYSGDFKISPDYNWTEEKIKEKINFPIAYTMDVAILENSQNKVIEYNDFWAIGNYGIENIQYMRMIKDRYFEITRK